jgi:hypothetical protein
MRRVRVAVAEDPELVALRDEYVVDAALHEGSPEIGR